LDPKLWNVSTGTLVLLVLGAIVLGALAALLNLPAVVLFIVVFIYVGAAGAYLATRGAPR